MVGKNHSAVCDIQKECSQGYIQTCGKNAV